MTISIKSLLVGFAAVATLSSTSGTINYSYQDDAGEALSWWGTNKKDNYDIAIALTNASLVGKHIESIRIPFMAEDATDVTVWLSKELKLEKVDGWKHQVPDVMSVAVTPADGFINVALDEPYAIPEGGVYVGYTFRIPTSPSDEGKMPVATYSGTYADGMWVHTTGKILPWRSMAQELGKVSAIEVTLDGFDPIGAAVTDFPTTYVQANEPSVAKIRVSNHGSEPISSISCSYKVANKEGEAQIEFPSPILPLFNASTEVELPIPGIEATGTYTGTLTIDKVNGEPNTDVAATKEFTYVVIPFVPTYRTLMDEYTGTWCGWCPRGFACLERMNDEYGSDFIGVSYHNGDPMEIKNGVPSFVGGFPDAYLNRQFEVDPGYETINPEWQALRNTMAVADITPEARWTDAEHTSIEVSSVSRFVADESNANYKILYVLVADGLTGEGSSWEQSNYYSGGNPDGNPYMDQFYTGESHIPGLVFNDVAIYTPARNGSAGSVPAEFEAGQELVHSFTINAADVVNLSGESLIQNPGKLRIVATLLDADGYAINTNRCDVGEVTALTAVEASPSEGEAQYFDLTGRRVANPANGLFIRLQNGKAAKVLLR